MPSPVELSTFCLLAAPLNHRATVVCIPLASGMGSYIIETAQYALNTDIKLQRSTEKYIATVTHRTLLIDYLCQVCYHLTESCHSICLPNTAV